MLYFPVRFATLIRLVLVYYAAYLTFFECRGDYSLSNQVAQHTCRQLHSTVYPIWDGHVKPQLDELDKKYEISSKVLPVFDKARAQAAELDEQYQISYKLDRYSAQFQIWAAKFVGDLKLQTEEVLGLWWARAKLYFEGSVAPITKHYVSQYKKSWGHSVDSLKSKAKINSELLYKTSKRHSLRLYALHVVPFYERVLLSVSANPYYVKVVEFLRPQFFVQEFKSLVAKLQQKSAEYSSKLQAKTDFLRAEINNFKKIDELKKKWRGDTSSIADVINDLLKDVKTAEPEQKEITLDTPESETAEELEESDNEDVVVTITSTRTRTATVTLSVFNSPSPDVAQESSAGLASVENTEEGVTNYGEDSSKAQLDYELKYWTSKVDKTLELAYNSLESEMKDFLNETIDELKARISANFTDLQQTNFQRYKVMGELIAAIDKDSEQIRETGEIIEEPEVDRQIMRDKIKEGYEVVEGSMKDAEVNLNAVHFKIMEKYFEVVQSTVDVVESFAETTILDFSNRLTGLIEILETNEDFEDELSWSAWKLFHKVKDLIFNIRDKIFQEAEAYKVKPRGTIKPQGLKPWADYLDNVNFHIRYLLVDNDEYLKLVRAKANIAYQLREGLTRELIAAKEKAEAEAKEEAEKAEQESEHAESAEDSPQQILNGEDVPIVDTPPQDGPIEPAEAVEELFEEVIAEEAETKEEPVGDVDEEPVEDEQPESVEVPILEEIEEEEAKDSTEEVEEPVEEEEEEVPVEEAYEPEGLSEEELSEIMAILHGEETDFADEIPVESFDEDNAVDLEASEEAPEQLEATD